MDRTGGTRRRSIVLVALLGAGLIAVAVALNINFIVVNWRTGLLLLLGVVSLVVLVGGLALNTAFLIREIRRSEQHDAFIHAVTHELKTPLASIKLYLQTLQHRELSVDKQHEVINTMLDDSERLQQTIDQILLAGKTGDARRVDNPTDVDVSEIVDECVALVGKRHHLVDGEVQFVDRASDEVFVVKGDPEELAAAVTNLVDNAIKYSNPPARVQVTARCHERGTVEICVRDHGVGIPQSELRRIFDRFYRVDHEDVRARRGTGLGLFVVKALVEDLGGRLRAHSDGRGKGTTMTISLPHTSPQLQEIGA